MNRDDGQNVDSLDALIREGASLQSVEAIPDSTLREWERQAHGLIAEFFGVQSEIALKLEANARAIRDIAGGSLTEQDRREARFNMIKWTLRCLTFMKAEIEFFGPRQDAERQAIPSPALVDPDSQPRMDGSLIAPMGSLRNVHPPEAFFENGVLHLRELRLFDELDVLLHEIAGSGNISLLVSQGGIKDGAFTCPPVPAAEKQVYPLSFIIRLASHTGAVMYVRVSINRESGNQPVCTITDR